MKFFLLLLLSLSCLSQDYLDVKAESGDGINSLLKRYGLKLDKTNKHRFVELNQNKFTKNYGLILSKTYYLPIKVYSYNGKSIRSTISNNDFDFAVKIQKYNDNLTTTRVKEEDYRVDNILWVPEYEFYSGKTSAKKQKPELTQRYMPILGKKHEKFKEISNDLSNSVFYLVSGHGGPDPGAMTKKNGKWLSEDEYAYDVILRLGKELAKNGAIVHFIVQDPTDGIRDERILKNSKLEFYSNGSEIDLNQRKRLQQRCDIINQLYDVSKDSKKNHHVVSIHIDSRAKKQIDIFFYHAIGSEKGKSSAEVLLKTIEEKYHEAQPGRGYEGSISTRNLYILNHTKPVVTFIELGNIMHQRDQQRILIPDNRQAIANWLKDGFLKLYK